MFPSLLQAESTDDDISDAMFKESCITEQTQYFFDNDEKSYSGVLDCGNCSRMYRAEKLPNTNLVFLITDAKATCLSCDPRPLRQAEQPSEGPDPCDMVDKARYRKGPDVCFDNNEYEDDSDCGGGTCLRPSLWPVFGFQLLLLWLSTSLQHSWPLHAITYTHTLIIESFRWRPEDTRVAPYRMYAEYLQQDIFIFSRPISAFPFANAKGCSFITSSLFSKKRDTFNCAQLHSFSWYTP